MELITSKDNKTLKYAQSLQRKKYRKLHGEYLAEGLRTVSDMMATGLVTTIFVKEDSNCESIISEAEQRGIKLWSVSSDLMHTIESTLTAKASLPL